MKKSEKVVSFTTKRNIHGTKQFGPLLKQSAKKHDIDNVYRDRAYDDRKNFNILRDINAEPAISSSSIRNNTFANRSKGCPLRRDQVLLIKKLGLKVMLYNKPITAQQSLWNNQYMHILQPLRYKLDMNQCYSLKK